MWLIGLLFGRFPRLAGLNWRIIGLCGAIVGFGVAYLSWHHHVYQSGYKAAEAVWQPRMAAQTAAYAKAAADAAAANAARVASFQATNERVTRELFDKTKEADALRRDRDLARVLLNLARQTAASRGAVSETGGGTGTAGASGTQGDGSLEGTVADAIGECRRNADRLDALAKVISEQL